MFRAGVPNPTLIGVLEGEAFGSALTDTLGLDLGNSASPSQVQTAERSGGASKSAVIRFRVHFLPPL